MSEPNDRAVILRKMAASRPHDAARLVGAADELDRLRAELAAATRRAELAEEALRGEYQSRDHPRLGTSAAPF